MELDDQENMKIVSSGGRHSADFSDTKRVNTLSDIKDTTSNNKDTEEYDNRIEKVSKPYTQFSKKIVLLCVLNLIMIEMFAMWMIYKSGDTSVISYLITSIAVECIAAVVWYMKNSEAEKKARISAEVERMKTMKILPKPFDTEISVGSEPDTYLSQKDGVG